MQTTRNSLSKLRAIHITYIMHTMPRYCLTINRCLSHIFHGYWPLYDFIEYQNNVKKVNFNHVKFYDAIIDIINNYNARTNRKSDVHYNLLLLYFKF